MSARQYKPFSYQVETLPLIVYPVKDENPLEEIFDPANEPAIEKHLDKLYQTQKKILIRGNYHILFVWNLDRHRMTDVWIHYLKNWSDSGPLVECLTFRDLQLCHDAGIASGDSLIVLGREEELRRQLNNLPEYLDRLKHQPIFPAGLQPKKVFNLP
jgi:hypothetical protein